MFADVNTHLAFGEDYLTAMNVLQAKD